MNINEFIRAKRLNQIIRLKKQNGDINQTN